MNHLDASSRCTNEHGQNLKYSIVYFFKSFLYELVRYIPFWFSQLRCLKPNVWFSKKHVLYPNMNIENYVLRELFIISEYEY